MAGNKKSKKTIIAVAAVAAVAVIAVGGFIIGKTLANTRRQREQMMQKTLDSLSITFKSADEVNSGLTGTEYTEQTLGGMFEYGTARIDAESLVKNHAGEMTVQGDKVIDTSKLGTYNVTFTLSQETGYGDTVTRDIQKTYTVADNTPPVIELKEEKVSVEYGKTYDPKSNIQSVADPIEGALSFNIDSSIDTKKAGDYTVTVSAKDEQGNEASKSFTVTVLPGETSSETSSVTESSSTVSETSATSSVTETSSASQTETSSTSSTSQTSSTTSSVNTSESTGASVSDGYTYAVYVNKAANTVTIYKKDDSGQYTIPYKAMVCSTGPATPTGTYYTYDDPSNSRWSPYYPWWPLYGGVYGMYAYGITGDILFHSVPYYSADPSDLEWEEYNKLGTSASMGCVRLAVKDVLWIFQNCPKGTMVVFYDDASNPGPLGKPEPIHIDPDSPNRGWDPTDPNPNNPWNN